MILIAKINNHFQKRLNDDSNFCCLKNSSSYFFSNTNSLLFFIKDLLKTSIFLILDTTQAFLFYFFKSPSKPLNSEIQNCGILLWACKDGIVPISTKCIQCYVLHNYNIVHFLHNKYTWIHIHTCTHYYTTV